MEKKSARVALLDMKRCQNVGIALAQFKCSHSDIRSAILSLDPSILDLDRLQVALEVVNTSLLVDDDFAHAISTRNIKIYCCPFLSRHILKNHRDMFLVGFRFLFLYFVVWSTALQA